MGSNLETQLVSKRARYAQTALTYYSLANTTWNWYKEAKAWFDARNEFTISVESDDPAYNKIHKWLLEQIPADNQRNLVAKIDQSSSRYGYDNPQVGVADRLILFYDSVSEQTVNLDGHKIRVHIDSDDPSEVGNNITTLVNMMKKKTESIIFTATSVEGRNAVVKFLRGIDHELQAAGNELQLFISSSWGDWTRKNSVTPRNLDSIVLKEGQKEALIADIHNFLESEEKYNNLGIPYHRGYLFYGPPGTGKSSLARAVATNIQANLYILSLRDLDKDTKLLDVMSNIKPGAVLLIEDIDTLATARDRDDEGDNISTSALLNALDGITTPHGLITIMTSNRREVLDPALVRPGRVDQMVELGYLDRYQINTLVRKVFGVETDFVPERDITPAEVIEIFKSNMNDPEAAVTALKELVNGS